MVDSGRFGALDKRIATPAIPGGDSTALVLADFPRDTEAFHRRIRDTAFGMTRTAIIQPS